jgi:hypothetical protein
MKAIFLLIFLSLNAKKEYFISSGYGKLDYYYDDEFEKGKMTPVYIFNLFFKFTNQLFIKKGINFKGSFGLNFSRHSFYDSINKITWSSGLSPQSINLSLIMEKNFLTGEIGYHYDAGPQWGNMEGVLKLNNSDRQDAIFLNLKIKSGENSPFKAEANFEYIFTFPVKCIWYLPYFPEMKILIVYHDLGDHIIFNPKISYSIKNFDLGVNFIHRYITKDKEWHKYGENLGVDALNLSISPFLRLNLLSLPLILEIHMYIWDEYFPYGITLIGKNTAFGTNKCATLNLISYFK